MAVKGNPWRRRADGKSSLLRSAKHIESDWSLLLPSLGPRTFHGEFGEFQGHFWNWYWMTVNRRRAGFPLTLDELVYLLIWGRGMGKSASVEWAAILEGALIGQGYVLYVCGTQALAKKHVLAIQERLESSEVADYYPGLGEPKMGKYGTRGGWRQDFLHTKNGWGVAAYGLDQGVRGGRLGDRRPTMIILDDIDGLDDSPELINKKLETITKTVLPTGTKGTIVLFAQNLIHSNSVLNKIYTGRERVLTHRTVSKFAGVEGPVPALLNLRYERQGLHDVIVAGTPTWKHFDLDACKEFLAKSGLKAFLAEYQHDLRASEEGLVLPEFDPEVHVITWSEFQAVYGVRGIPSSWVKDVGLDWGSTGLDAHPTVTSAVTTSGEESRLPGMHFLYWGGTFDEGCLVDEVAERIRRELLGSQRTPGIDPLDPDRIDSTGIRMWKMSHEAKSERDTFRRKYGLPFTPANAAKNAGIAMFRHYLRVDYTRDHPFRPGKPGYSLFYWIVDDDQLKTPIDDKGLKRHREEIVEWKYRPNILKDAGIGMERPVKFRDDAMDSIRFLTDKWLPPSADLPQAEKLERALPKTLRLVNTPTDPGKQFGFEIRRMIAMGKARERVNREIHGSHWLDEDTPPPWQEREWEQGDQE